MPTRIVLKKTSLMPSPRRVGEPRTPPTAFRTGFMNSTEFVPSPTDAEAAVSATEAASSSSAANNNNRNKNNSNRSGGGSNTTPRTNKAKLPVFRSSILREFSGRDPNDDDEIEKERMSTDDIRASPRLLGYIFAMIAGAVMLVSVVQFYKERGVPRDEILPDRDRYYYTGTLHGLVYQWKLWGAIYVSSAGVGLCLMTVLVHFDTMIAPKLWLSLFRDGSLAERNWIIFLIVFWAAGVYICTSTLSVGESQANVFFTTWIAFASTALNMGVWRESAGLPSMPQRLSTLYDGNRETTYNWMWICFFSCIFAGAITDVYVNRNDIVLRFRGRDLDLTHKDWVIILAVVWSEVTLCGIAIFLNEVLQPYCLLPCRINRPSGRYRWVLGWRHLEGLIIAADTGCKFWVILKITGVDNVVNGLSNAYFGVWGSFFAGVSALGTWLRENKNTEYMVLEEEARNGDDDDGSAA